MTLDETIKEFTDWAKDNRKEQNFWAAERDENDETNPLSYADCEGLARDAETRAEYHEQLAEWLTDYKELKNSIGAVKLSNMKEALELIREYKSENIAQKKMIAEYKRLLKMAVEDFKQINSDILTCKYCKWYSAETDECAYYPDDTPCEQICGWKHEGEALKLMGETNDEP